MGIWLHTHTVTTKTLPQIWVSRLTSYLMQVCKLCHYTFIEAVEPCKLHPMFMSYIYELFEYLLRLWMGICHPTHIDTPTYTSPYLGELTENYLMQVCKPCHYALVKAVEPCKAYPMAMSYIYEVFEDLLRLWMGIWLHTNTVTTTDASSDLERLAEILPDASLQTMPLRFG
jgi:hypothetical protein